jgi:hypothetical protein
MFHRSILTELRRQRAMAGIKEHLEQGIWCKKPPMGYTAIKEGKERRIIVDETDKKLRKTFRWKAEGIKNDVILLRLKAMGNWVGVAGRMSNLLLQELLQIQKFAHILNAQS